MQHDPARSSKLHLFTVPPSLKVSKTCLHPPPAIPARIQIQDVRPQVDCGRYPVEGDASASRRGLRRRSSGTATRCSRASSGTARAGRAEVAARRRSSRSGTTAGGGRFESTELGPLAVHGRGVGRSLRDLARRARAQGRRRARRTWRASSPEGAAAARRRASSTVGDGARRRRRPTAHERDALARPLEVDVDRVRARFGAWYELFPRSWGGFAGVEKVLPQLAELGFDVLYLPPIHPIGRTNRKGRNNALDGRRRATRAARGRSAREEGGHDAIHPELGTIDGLRRASSRRRAKPALEIALDFAIQCSPDHPWLEGASRVVPPPARRDDQVRREPAQALPGHLQRQLRLARTGAGLWEALRDVVLHWVERGVRVFRVDNPHTKPLPFWEWLIARGARGRPRRRSSSPRRSRGRR